MISVLRVKLGSQNVGVKVFKSWVCDRAITLSNRTFIIIKVKEQMPMIKLNSS